MPRSGELCHVHLRPLPSILARQIGTSLQPIWGQSVVVDNKAGASGNIGTQVALRDYFGVPASLAANATAADVAAPAPVDR